MGRVSRALATGGGAVLLLSACGSVDAPPNAPGGLAVDAADRPYCDAVAREQARSGATDPRSASEADRRAVADAAALAPGEIAGDWHTLRDLTDRAAGAVSAAGDDPNRVDRAALVRLGQQAQPAIERIRQVTAARCGVAFRPRA